MPLSITTKLPPAELFERATPPKLRGSVSMLISPADYPAEAIRNSVEGQTVIALTVNEIGRATGCAIAESSKSLVLDVATCRLLTTRARFDPARDRNQLPVTSAVKIPVIWNLPELARLPFGPWDAQVRMTIGPEGELRSCAESVHQIRRVPGPRCDMFGRLSPANLRKLRGKLTGDVNVVIDHRMLAGHKVALPRRPTGEIAFRTVMEVTVAPDGKVSDCRYLEQFSDQLQQFQSCTRGSPVFVKSTVPTQMTAINTITRSN